MAKQKKPIVGSEKLRFSGPRRAKPVVGFYDLTGCNGCLLSFIFNEDDLLDMVKHMDIKAFRFIKGTKEEKQFDIVFMEGLVASNDDLEVLKSVRSKTKVLVALGACACTGCIPAYRNFIDPSKYAELMYERVKELKDQPATPINEHVPVDYYIPGCPPDKQQILDFIKDIVLGKDPYDYDRPVCVECRLNENRCLLADDKMCLGSITRGGCGAVCTNGKLECWGCRGSMPDANIPLLVKLLEEKGFTKEHIKQRLRTFAGLMIEKPPAPKAVRVRKKPKRPKKKKKVKKRPKKKKVMKKKVKKKAKKKIVKKKSSKKSIKKRPSARKRLKRVSATRTKKAKKGKRKAVRAKKVKKRAAKVKKKAARAKPGTKKQSKSFIGMIKGRLKKK